MLHWVDPPQMNRCQHNGSLLAVDANCFFYLWTSSDPPLWTKQGCWITTACEFHVPCIPWFFLCSEVPSLVLALGCCSLVAKALLSWHPRSPSFTLLLRSGFGATTGYRPYVWKLLPLPTLLALGRWFLPGALVSSTTETDISPSSSRFTTSTLIWPWLFLMR